MIALLRAIVLGPLRHRPWRALASLAGVAAGVASVVATASASRAAVASLAEGVEAVAGRARLEVTRPGGVPEGALARLRPLTGDAVIVPVVEEIALLPALGGAVRVLGLELPVDAAVRRLDVAAGPDAAEALLRGEGILIPAALARRLGAAAGATVTLSARARTHELQVLGVFDAEPAAAWARVVIADIALAQELFERVGRLDRIELVLRPGVAEAELEARARALLPPDHALGRPGERRAATSRMVRALEFNLTALSGISLLVGGVLVATTLATAVVQRRHLLALARSLGAGRGQLAGVLLMEAGALGFAGGVLGVAAGLLGARAALDSVRATVAAVVRDAPASPIRFDLAIAGWGLLAGVAVALAAATLPVLEAARTPPLQGLAGETPRPLGQRSRRRALALGSGLLAAAALLARLPAWSELPVAALLGALALLAALLATSGVAVETVARLAGRLAAGTPRLAAAALASGRRRAAWAAGAAAVTMALAVAIATMVASFRATVVAWTGQAMRADLWVRPATGETGYGVGRLDPEIVRVAATLFGAAAVDPFHAASATFRGEPVRLGAGAMDVVARHGGVPFLDGHDSRAVFAEVAARGGAVVNEPFARRHGVGRGDLIALAVPGGTIERIVRGVFLDYSESRGLVVLDRADFLTLFPDDGPQELALFLPPEIDPAAARDRLLAALGGRFLVEVLDNRELRAHVIGAFDRTFAITAALQTVAAAVAVTAVVTVLFALVSERRRDLAVIRAVGGSRLQVAGAVLVEAALLGLTGVAGGSAAGLAIGAILVKVVNVQSFNWTMRLLPPWGAIAATAGAVLLAALAAGAAPAVAASRFAPGEGIRDDG